MTLTQASPIAGDETLLARSIRFAVTVTAPIALTLVLGPQTWLVYALITSIAGYSVDNGGHPLTRLAWIGAVGIAVVAGAELGSVVAADRGLTIAAFAFGGVVYALSESGHQATLTVARFFCFSIAIGALYTKLAPLDVGVIAVAVAFVWTISVVWDAAIGHVRVSTLPSLREIASDMHRRLIERWTFAVVVAIAIPVTYLISVALGEMKPYWAMLALVLVLRVDFISSRNLMIERFLGTVLGVAAAAAYAAVLPGHAALMLGLVLAALARWPAQQRHGALGVGALTAFVMLMFELVATSRGQAMTVLEARVMNTLIGLSVALLALGLDRALYWLVMRSIDRWRTIKHL